MSNLDLNKIKITVGLSGGVDSSVAALLLKQAGFDVTGVYLKCYWTYEGCQSDQDRNSAARVASVLDIPFEVWDFEKEYRKTVIDYFFEEYKKGRTPNPDVVCNREIKFGLFLNKALGQMGPVVLLSRPTSSPPTATQLRAGAVARRETHSERHPSAEEFADASNNIYIATGHYARIGIVKKEGRSKESEVSEQVVFPKFSQWEEVRDSDGVRYVDIKEYLGYLGDLGGLGDGSSGNCGKLGLYGGVGGKKDQSYFLYDIPRSTYEHILYPLGNLTKTQVREIATKENLPTAGRPDSSGICFIGEVNVEKFLKERIKEHEGNVVTSRGEIIGKHKGVEFYTIGQRHGFEVRLVGSDSSKDLLKGSPLVPRTRVPPQRALLYESSPDEGSSRPPYYVIGKNIERNELVVGMGEECKREAFTVQITNDKSQITNKIQSSKLQKLFVRIRNLGEFIPCTVEETDGQLRVRLDYPVFGIAPGQSAVFYRKVNSVDSGTFCDSLKESSLPQLAGPAGSSSRPTASLRCCRSSGTPSASATRQDTSSTAVWEVVGGGVIQ